MGCDQKYKKRSELKYDFNPRSPSGLRPAFRGLFWPIKYFNPRSPSGLRLQILCPKPIIPNISIHAARVGCDGELRGNCEDQVYFNPRSPSGLRPRFFIGKIITKNISIHAARVGCDHMLDVAENGLLNFNPRSPSGLRRREPRRFCSKRYFNPRSPSGLRPIQANIISSLTIFQSTQPEWAATNKSTDFVRQGVISIHAARVGCDRAKCCITLL